MLSNLSQDLKEIAVKALNGKRLSLEEGLALYDRMPTSALGWLADLINEQMNEGVVFFNVNRHINPTNVCVKSCKFCAFSRKPGEEGAYEYSMDEIISRAHKAAEQGATEVHIVGGLHPRWNFNYYLKMLEAIKLAEPHLHIKAFTAVEIDWLAAKARMPISETLMALKNSGLGSMPGGGAEIFHPEIREKICDTKTDADRWLMIHNEAHKIGLKTNATMLYGHIENSFHRIDHMDRLRKQQDLSQGFQVFIPLAFQPFENEMGIDTYTNSELDLRTISIARIYLDNFQHIKAYWIMLGQDTAQTALQFGANDLDGTVAEEKISRMAGGQSGMVMNRSEIRNLIYRAGRLPVERNTVYDPVDKETWEQRRQLKHIAPKIFDFKKETLSFTDTVAITHFLKSSTLPEVLSLNLESKTKNELVVPRSDRNWIKETVREREEEMSVGDVWRSTSAEGTSIGNVARDLYKNGTRTLAGKSEKTELDLTTSEWLEIHRTFHEVGIRTAAKLELSAPIMSKGEPFWETFVTRLEGVRLLQAETQGFLQIWLDCAPDSFLTPIDFCKAAAITRYLLPTLQLKASFWDLHPLAPRKNTSREVFNDPALKLVPVLNLSGTEVFI